MMKELSAVYKAIGAIELHLNNTCNVENGYLPDMLQIIQDFVDNHSAKESPK